MTHFTISRDTYHCGNIVLPNSPTISSLVIRLFLRVYGTPTKLGVTPLNSDSQVTINSLADSGFIASPGGCRRRHKALSGWFLLRISAPSMSSDLSLRDFFYKPNGGYNPIPRAWCPRRTVPTRVIANTATTIYEARTSLPPRGYGAE